jgi:hypothetical protein
MARLVECAATVLLVTLFGWVGGCSSEGRCSYNHQGYPKGASFPAGDGCNVCTCVASGQIACTEKACLGDAGFAHPADTAPDAPDGAIADAPPDAPWPIDSSAPDRAAPADYCVLPTALSFYLQQQIRVPGGIASYTETYHLDNTGLLITRNWWNGYDAGFVRTCTPVLPACGLTNQITVWNVGADLADPAVQAALASPPYTTFGAVKWPSDAWSIAADASGPILVGLPCGDPDAGPCQPIPPPLERLRDDLQALAVAGAAQPACVEQLKP